MKKKRKTKLVRIPEYLWARYKIKAIKKGLTLSKLLEIIIKKYD